MFDNTNPEYNYIQLCVDTVGGYIVYTSVDVRPIEKQLSSIPSKEETEEEIPQTNQDGVVISYEERFVFKDYKVRGKDGLKLDSAMIMQEAEKDIVNISFGDNIEIVEVLPSDYEVNLYDAD